MDRPPTYRFNFESSPEDEENTANNTDQARKIGAFTRNTLGKRAQKEKDQEENEKKSDKDQEKSKKNGEKDKSKDAEKASNPRIEVLKRRALKEQLDENIPKLEAELAATRPQTPQHAAALAALSVETRLKQKIVNPEAESDQLIDEEFDRRMADLPESEVELLEILGEDLPPIVELPVETEKPAVEHTSTKLPTVTVPAPAEINQPALSAASKPQEAVPVESTDSGSSGDYGGYSPSVSSTPETPIRTSPVTNPNIYQKPTERAPERNKKAGSFAAAGLFEQLITRENTSAGPRERPENNPTERIIAAPEATKRHLMNREEELKQAVMVAVAESTNKTRESRSNIVARTPVAEILRQTISSPAAENLAPQVQVATEAKPQEFNESPSTSGESQPVRKNESIVKNIEQLTTPQILRAAEAIIISGISVRKLYETNQIDRKGLVHIVKEKLRGRSVKQALEKVAIGRERQKERAIEMRHDDPDFVAGGAQQDPPTSNLYATPVVTQVMPNNPDPTSVQPITPEYVATDTATQPTPSRSIPENAAVKKGYAVNIAIAVTGAALVLAWLFL